MNCQFVCCSACLRVCPACLCVPCLSVCCSAYLCVPCLSVCRSVCLCVPCLSVCRSAYLCVSCLSVCALPGCVSPCLSVCFPACLRVCPACLCVWPACLCVCPFYVLARLSASLPCLMCLTYLSLCSPPVWVTKQNLWINSEVQSFSASLIVSNTFPKNSFVL
jgi:hypothetical protein